MLTTKVLVLLVLLSLSLSQKTPLAILSVSGDPTTVQNPVYSSLRGGRMIYIKAMGHSPDPTQNTVLVGNIPCKIPSDGVTDTFISCVTGDSGSTSDVVNLLVTLISSGTSVTSSGYNIVSYLRSWTPQLNGVYPTAAFGGQNVNLLGYHYISNLGDGLRNMGDITKLLLGSDLCSRFDVVQDAISATSNQNILCVASNQQEAGKYNVSEQLTPGFADKSVYLRRASLDPNEYFEFSAVPSITSVSPSTGNIGGQYLTINGNGFSPSLANNSVTVDGTNCKVTSSGNGQISCILDPKNTSASSKLTTNSSSQQNGYFSGAGLQYERYRVPSVSTISKLVTIYKSSNKTELGTPQEVGFRADVREGDVYGSNYAQIWKGYFTAPVSGVYTFRGYADEVFALYFSQNYGSVQLPATPLIYNDKGYQLYGNFYYFDYPTAEANVTLQAGKSYYLECYHINNGYAGFFNLEVNVPSTDVKNPSQVNQVDYITTNATVQPEVITFSMVNGTNGTIQLTINRTTTPTYFKSVNVTYGCTDTDFYTVLTSFDGFQYYGISVVRKIYDSTNKSINTTTGAARIDYVVSVSLLRPTTISSQKFGVKYFGSPGTFTQTTNTPHSPLISGTFGLSIGGVPIQIKSSSNIPYNIDANSLQAALRSTIVGFQLVEVSLTRVNGDCGYSCTWIIQYKGYKGAIPSLTLNGALLSGGANTPTVSRLIRRYYSPNIIFDPVDYRFLNTYSNTVNVQVSTNGIPAFCNGTCSYAFNTYSEITSLTYSASTLSFALSNPNNLSFATTDITVSVGGQACNIIDGSTISSVNCYMQNNTDNTPILVAGSLMPLVYIKPYGIANLNINTVAPTISLLATSLSVSSAGNNGGVLVSLNGKGFPLDKSQIKITLCSNLATIKSVNNIKVDFYLPSCSTLGSKTVTINVGSITNTNLTFTYVDGSTAAPTIFSLSPNSANPGVKGTMEINGQKFGTNSSAVQVFLTNATGKIYKLNVLTLNDTYIKVGLPGGEAGSFQVQVNTLTNGDSIASPITANTFTYSFTVSSISPSTGSYYGGTLITITGSNFSPDSQQTLAYVGWTLNWFCNIQSINSTSIKCRTPPISSAYKAGSPVSVVVSTRLLILNSCVGTCTFTYILPTASPTLTNISLAKTYGGLITINGSLLLDSTNFTSVSLTNTLTGAVTVLTPTNKTNTSVTFNVTKDVVSGSYVVKVRNSIGESNGLSLIVYWTPGSTFSWTTNGSSTAGNVISLTNGAGYPSQIDGKTFSVSITSAGIVYPLNIVSCCSTYGISIEMPPAATGTVFILTFTGPVNVFVKNYTTASSYTPTANITSVSSSLNTTVGPKNITFKATNNISATIVSIKLVSTLNKTHTININNGSWTTTGTGLTATTTFAATLNAGSYKLIVNTSPYGYIAFNSTIDISLPSNLVSNTQKVSFNGATFTISASYLSPVSFITVNGFKGSIVSYNTSAATYVAPALVTNSTQSAFGLTSVGLLPNSQFTFFSDPGASANNVSAAFDGLINTFYGSSNTQCWIGMDAGAGIQASVSRISFFPNLNWTNVASKILYSVFEGSNDKTTWKTIAKVDQTVHSGWNVFPSADTTPYRYIRFSHNSTSSCNLAEVQLYGILYSTLNVSLTSQSADVIYNDGFNTQTLTGALEYRQDNTPVVTSVSPRYGDIFGGYTLTLTGTNLNASAPTITIDGVACNVTATNTTTILCTVGARLKTPTVANNFSVVIGSSIAVLKDTFLYVLKWSDPKTWGVDTPPIDNDLVYVPLGLTLLVDVNTPILNGIAVQGGTLIFSDDVDLVVQAGFIIMNGGTFLAGTEKQPHNKKLTFIMYGNYFGKQMPMFGNKGIGCLNCKFYMYGTPRITTWTTIAATIKVGDTSFTVNDDFDWKVGEQIAVASTSFVHYESEQRTIVAVSGKTITVDTPFKYQHVSLIQTYGTNDKLAMQAEVGLLTRNIKMMGDKDSAVNKYGSHLMLSGQRDSGFEAQVGYSEFTQCGQPQILGRYCIHFHMAGDVPTSFARGNAVHQSHARVITIHGVHYLLVEKNVGYRVKGHNFFVEDGIETHNIIRNNLAISSLTSTNMLQTDISVASFWVTHPTNDFYGNSAAGGDFYGIWYEIKANPDGPSATMDVCPKGNPLGYVANNVAHSNIRFGLRILTLAPRLYPCSPVSNYSDPDDPWKFNPSIPAVYSNFTIYKNLQDGVLAEQVGNVIFNNFTVAQNYHSGVQIYLADVAKEAPLFNNTAIIGKSNGNAHSNISNYTNGMSAVITGRIGAFNFTNIRIYNFPAGSLLLQTCRLCDDMEVYTNLGTQIYIQGWTLSQVNGKMLRMIGMKRDVIYDTDGSLSQMYDGKNRTSAAIVQGYNHIAKYATTTCPPPSNLQNWDGSLMCDSSVSVRRVAFTNPVNARLFKNMGMKVAPLSNITQTIDPNISSTLYTTAYTHLDWLLMDPKKVRPSTWCLPFLTGQTYNIWWSQGIDFSQMAIFTTPYFPSDDKGIIFKFNYSQSRETFHVGPLRGQLKLSAFNYISQSPAFLDSNNCTNGQFYHDNSEGSQRMMEICINGKNKANYQFIQIDGVVCELMCPAPAGTFVKETFLRKWSNATQWPNGKVPQAGDNVTLNGNWTILLDMDPAPINYFIIDGTIVVDDTRDVNITANSIHLRAGNITVGSATKPFYHKFVIQLNGQKNGNGFYIDPVIAGNKYMVVTGTLNLFGVAPNTVTSYLTKTALKGDSSIYVNDTTNWAVGDTLVISPSFSTYSEYQKVTISAINADGSLSLSTPLQYTHYGSSQLTVNNQFGTLDTRARVGHVNRNIRIVPGPDAGWGFSVIVYGYNDGAALRVGSVNLDGVQFADGGQLDTLNAPLTFINTAKANAPSSITSCSFLNCKADCIYIQNGRNINIDSNVFYIAWVIAVEANTVLSVNITNNLIIGVSSRPTMPEGGQLTAGLALYQYVNPLTDNILVFNNFVLGSSQHGFAFSHILCSQIQTNALANNTAGSAKIGFIFKTNNKMCQAFSYAKAFACEIGEICAPPGIETIVFSKFIMVDNLRSLTLKSGGTQGKTNNSAFVYDSYISALSRPTCAECYGPTATKCSGNYGIRMFVPSANGQILPTKSGPAYDVVCKQPVYDGKSFFYNVIFDNFRQTYSGNSASSVSTSCSNNFVFRPHSSSWDFVASANMYNSTCTNCDSDSFLTVSPPNLNMLGWFGGCGDMVCTGLLNFLISDWTGNFLGSKGSIIPNQNNTVAVNQNCTLSTSMNAYTCPSRLDFSVLEYQNTAADAKSRIMWPVSLRADGTNYTTLTNGFREWDWVGTQPLNHRIGRFNSIVRSGMSYNMSFASQPPHQLQIQLQKRNPLGNNSNYITVRIYYPVPNMIRVVQNGVIIDPILLTDFNNTTPGISQNMNVSKCGSNIFYYNNNTISFVVTEDLDCVLSVQLTQTVQLTTHFSMNISNFFNSNTSTTNFINNLCAFLNIVDTSRVKVVGVFSGSTTITTTITPTIDPNSTDPSLPDISDLLSTHISSGSLATNMSGISGFGSMIGASAIYLNIPDLSSGGDTTSVSSNVGLIAGVAASGVVLIVASFVTFIYCIRRRSKIAQLVIDNEQVMNQKLGIVPSVPSFLYSDNFIDDGSEIKINKHGSSKKVHPEGKDMNEEFD